MPWQRRVLGSEHPTTLSSKDAQGYLLLRVGRLREAERVYREVLLLRAYVLGPAQGNTRYSTLGLGDRAGAEREFGGWGCAEAFVGG